MINIRLGGMPAVADVKRLWDKIAFSRGRNPKSIQLALEETDLLLHAWDGSLLVATARVLTDGAYYATIWDVIVDPEYQGLGIGRAVLHRAVAPFIGRGFSFIALFSAESKEPFYERLGFVGHPRGMILQEENFPEKIDPPNALKD